MEAGLEAALGAGLEAAVEAALGAALACRNAVTESEMPEKQSAKATLTLYQNLPADFVKLTEESNFLTGICGSRLTAYGPGLPPCTETLAGMPIFSDSILHNII